ncbi:MAG: stalk domain-containing protein [Cellulosilyticaceae bacterium]
MKLRQKLAMVLAATMIVAAVPVTTMAYSTNQIHGQVSAVIGQNIKLDDNLRLVIDLEDTLEENEETVFYLDYTDFAVDAGLYNTAYLAAIDTLKENIVNHVNANDFRVKNVAATEAKTTPGAIATKITTEDVKITLAYKGNEFKSTDKVAEIKVEYFVNEEGKKATKTITFTAADLEAAGINLSEVASAKNVYTFNFDEKGNLTDDSTISKATPFGGKTKIEVLSSSQVRVTVEAVSDLTKVALPIAGQMTGESPKVVVDSYDSSVSVSKTEHYLTKESIGSDKLTVTAKDAKKINVAGGEIAGFTVKENHEDAISNGAKKADRTIVLDLTKYSDLVFTDKQTITIEGKGAFAPNKRTLKSDEYKVDGKTLEIYLPNEQAIGTTTGAWEVTGVTVEAENLKYGAEEGDVNVKITSGNKMFEEMNEVLAVVAEFAVDVTVQAADLVAGRDSIVPKEDNDTAIITITENVKESLDDKRWAYFNMPEGVYVTKADFLEETKLTINEIEVTTSLADNSIKADVNKDGYVTGFSLEFQYNNNSEKLGKLDPAKANQIVMEIPLFAPLGTEAGEYNLEIESKYLEELAGEHVLAVVAAPITVEYDQAVVKVGLAKQELGDITITETANKMIEEGEIVIEIEDVKLETAKKDIEIVLSEDSKMQANVKSVTNGKNSATIVIEIDRAAKEAGSLTIKGLVGTVDRTVPEGYIGLEVSGSAIQDEENKVTAEEENVIKVAEYIKVGTLNTEDNNGSQVKDNVAVFTIGQETFTLNGEEKEMDAAPFVTSKDRVMVPVRYLSEAFGVEAENILFNSGVVTMFVGEKIVQLENGSNVAVVNGVKVSMDEKMTIKEDRAYAPMGEIARILGVKVQWDNDNKTATFKR